MNYLRKNLITTALPLLIGTILVFFSISTCQRFEPTGFLHITTDSIQSLAEGNYKMNGSLVNIGDDEIIQHGFCWSITKSPTIEGELTQLGSRNAKGSFSSIVTNLTAGATFYVRAYVMTRSGTEYGEEKNFTTSTPMLPTVTTASVSSITEYSAECGGSVIDDGGTTVTARGVCWSTSTGPTTSDSYTTDGTGAGSFNSTVTGLSRNTTHYLRSYATNSVGTSYGSEVSFKTWSGSVTDYDGNVYPTAVIGLQTWMAENLNVTHYADGSEIPQVVNNAAWEALIETEKAFCWYDNNSSYGDLYGALYTWAAAMNGVGSSDVNPSGVQGVCPDDWHLPGDAEWKQLEIYLGMTQTEVNLEDWRGTDEGGQLKESGTEHWLNPNTGATNSSGFTALPSGLRDENGSFWDDTDQGYLWTATEGNATVAWNRSLDFDKPRVARDSVSKRLGYSVRCIEGESSLSSPTVTTTTLSDITETSAQSGGDVTSDGGASVTERGVCWSTSSTPTITDSKTNDGTGSGSYTSAVTGLSQGTTYYIRAYATNSEGTNYGDEVRFRTKTSSGSTVTDYDGNVYQTVQIGDQEWMAENLNVTRYPDGSAIPLVANSNSWDALGPGDEAYCWYDDNISNGDTYGALYTWDAAMNAAESSDASPSGVQGVCPDGMHMPGDGEWKELEMYLGMSQAEADQTAGRGTDEGGKLKEAGTIHWNSPNEGATNESGFTALAAGSRSHDGSFSELGFEAVFWTATEETNNPMIRKLFNTNSTVSRYLLVPYFGHSVRCVGD